MLWEFQFNRLQWGMVAKHGLNPKNFYFDAALTPVQVSRRRQRRQNQAGKRASRDLNLYLFLEEKGEDKLHKRRPHLDLSTTRYPWSLDAFETEFQKKRNETYETFQLLSRKQLINEWLEQFHSVMSGRAARCNFGKLEGDNFEGRVYRKHE